MTSRHRTGVGLVVALLAGGCAAQPAATPSPDAKPAAGPVQPSAGDKPDQWEARNRTLRPGPADGLAADQLAAQVSTYAKAADAAASPDRAAAPPGSAVKFATPSAVAAPPPTAPLTVVRPRTPEPTPADPKTVDPKADVIRSAVDNGPLTFIPHEVPESADNVPPADPAASPAHDPLGRTIARLARDHPHDLAAQLDYQVYAMLGGDASVGESARQQLASTNALSPDDRDDLAAVVNGFGNFRSGLRANPNQTPTQSIRPLEQMVAQLRTSANLTISPPVLCRQVYGFGQYDPITPPRLPTARGARLWVYCEVANFQPRQRPDGKWEIRLAEKVTLFAADGREVWHAEPLPTVDVCQTRRQDLFGFVNAAAPARLPPGTYKLRMSVTDQIANKVDEADATVWTNGG